MSRAADLAGRLAVLSGKYGVPGAQVAVLADGEIVDAAVGVLSTATGVEATGDAVFHIGSITKVWTATLVLQLVDEGSVDLDAPVRRYLPEFRVRDEEAAAAITVRQLLSHTSGIEGDLFVDTGRGDDAVEKFVPAIADAGLVHRPGEMFSYCSSGYVLLGRVVEVLRGKPFAAVVRERLAGPLGLARVAANAEEAILFRAADDVRSGPARFRPHAPGRGTRAGRHSRARRNQCPRDDPATGQDAGHRVRQSQGFGLAAVRPRRPVVRPRWPHLRPVRVPADRTRGRGRGRLAGQRR